MELPISNSQELLAQDRGKIGADVRDGGLPGGPGKRYSQVLPGTASERMQMQFERIFKTLNWNQLRSLVQFDGEGNPT